MRKAIPCIIARVKKDSAGYVFKPEYVQGIIMNAVFTDDPNEAETCSSIRSAKRVLKALRYFAVTKPKRGEFIIVRNP